MKACNINANEFKAIEADLLEQDVVFKRPLERHFYYEYNPDSEGLDYSPIEKLREYKIKMLNDMIDFANSTNPDMDYICKYLGQREDRKYDTVTDGYINNVSYSDYEEDNIVDNEKEDNFIEQDAIVVKNSYAYDTEETDYSTKKLNLSNGSYIEDISNNDIEEEDNSSDDYIINTDNVNDNNYDSSDNYIPKKKESAIKRFFKMLASFFKR
jgi:hypothetical protein